MMESHWQEDPAKGVLLVLDAQNDFCHEDGSLSTAKDLSAISKALANLRALLPLTRARGIPIILVKTEHHSWSNSALWVNRGVPGRVCLPGTWGCEFCEGIEPASQDLVIVKHRYSAFIGTNLDLILRSRGFSPIFLSGFVTAICVDTTARDGFMLGHRIVILEDCIADYVPARHKASLEVMRSHFAEVMQSDAVFAQAE